MSPVLVAVLVAGCALAGAVGFALWAGSSLLLVPRGYDLMPEFTVLDYRDGTVVLPAPVSRAQFADTRKEGRYGLVWGTGYGHLGPVLEDDGERVTRPLRVVAGTAPAAGEPARIDTFLYRRDPAQDLGLPFREVAVPGEVGELAGWWLPGGARDGASSGDEAAAPAGRAGAHDAGGPGRTGVLVLHGRRRGERAETLRALPTLAEDGRAVLVLAYRNHRGSPPSPDGFYHYGATEADDALAGVAFLAAQGVRRVVVFGFSMGGATALEAIKRWPPDAPELLGLILDSPLIDPTAVAEQRIRLARVPLPRLWTRATLALARQRSGLRWRALDQRRSAASIVVPVLLIAGVEDRTVPIATVDAFAERLPSVRYRRVANADHIEAWNRDPSAYEAWLRDFLASLGEGSPS